MFNFIDKDEYWEVIKNQICFVYPVLRYHSTHYLENELLMLIIFVVGREEKYIYNINHPDAKGNENIDNVGLVEPKEVWTTDVKFMSEYYEVYSAQLFAWYENIEFNLSDNILERFYIDLGYDSTGDLIPITKHFESAEEFYTEFEKYYDVTDLYPIRAYNEAMCNSLMKIEYNMLHCNADSLDKLKIGSWGDFLYSNYNWFTATGRPSNSWNGVNLAALNKKDGTRKVIVSRYDDGLMLNLDYDSFHVRLIGNLIGYKFSSGSVHSQFGKLYFGKDELTSEEYELSKTITFKQLYSEHLEFEIEYFEKVINYRKSIWEKFKSNGYIETPIFKRQIRNGFYDNMSESKLFNYLIQAYETEYMMTVMPKIHRVLEGHMSLFVLYVYDSILIDYSKSDGIEIIEKIISCMSGENMEVHVEIGKSYHDMVDVSSRFNKV